MKKRILSLLLAVLLLTSLFSACGESEAPAVPAATAEPTSEPEPVTLTIAGGWEDCRAIEAVGREFTAKYPNCTIVYEYLQDYYVSLQKRMTGEAAVDLFFTSNIQADSELQPYALDLKSEGGPDLSNAFPGLLENFAYMENGARTDKLYAVPLGAEMRGLYVNKTLLASVGLAVPTNQAELLAACETLKASGYIPFHGNPGNFAQTLLYPWVCSLIANAPDPQAAHDRVNAREPGLSEMFREPFEFLYTLVENDYYDYKRAQSELQLFTETTDAAYARDFFNVAASGDSWAKLDDVGRVPFLPSPMSLLQTMEKTRDDYHSAIDYVFIPAPVGEEGGFAYLSPAHGIAVNKDGANLEWSVRFLEFLFQPEANTLFAEEFNIIPNTADALDYIRARYAIPEERTVQLGQVTFDYEFYGTITAALLDLSKANNPKYMQTNADGTTSLYPLDTYLAQLEDGFKANGQ